MIILEFFYFESFSKSLGARSQYGIKKGILFIVISKTQQNYVLYNLFFKVMNLIKDPIFF